MQYSAKTRPHIMGRAVASVAVVVTGAIAVLPGPRRSSAQATLDTENRYPNVGAIMVWRVDESNQPVELRASPAER